MKEAMTAFRCLSCGREQDEPYQRREVESHEFQGAPVIHTVEYEECIFCGSENLEEYSLCIRCNLEPMLPGYDYCKGCLKIEDADAYAEEFGCEHGIHKDSGHPCNECIANSGNE